MSPEEEKKWKKMKKNMLSVKNKNKNFIIKNWENVIKVKHVLPPGAKKPMAQSAQPPVSSVPNCPALHPAHSIFLVPFAAGHAKHLILG